MKKITIRRVPLEVPRARAGRISYGWSEGWAVFFVHPDGRETQYIYPAERGRGAKKAAEKSARYYAHRDGLIYVPPTD